MRATSEERNLSAGGFQAPLAEFLFQPQPGLATGAFLFRGKNVRISLRHPASRLLLEILPGRQALLW